MMCDATLKITIDGSGSAYLECNRQDKHPGQHWDWTDHVMWSEQTTYPDSVPNLKDRNTK